MQHIRAHPITICSNLRRVLFLVIIPFVRGFVSALQGGFSKWLSGAWMDILVFLVMIAVAVWSWSRIRLCCDDNGLHISFGLLRRQTAHIPWIRMSTVGIHHAYYLRPFRAVALRVDTLGGGLKDVDFSVYLYPHHAEEIMSRVRRDPGPAPSHLYCPQTRSILYFALLTSHSFAGILFFATFVSQAGKLLGREFSDMLIGTMENVARNLAFGIPPAAVMLAYLLLLGWLVSFFLTFVRYNNMTIAHNPGALSITGGMFSHKEYYLRYQDINFVDIRQSIFTKVLHLYSLYISVAGYGKQTNDISSIIPTEPEQGFATNRKALFADFEPQNRQLYPSRFGFMRFISPALYLLLGIPLAMILLCRLFPNWIGFILFVGLMLMAPAMIFMAVRLIDFFTGGFAFDGKNYTLRYSKGFNLHTVIIPVQAVVMVELKQGIFQRFSGRCDLLLYTRAEGPMVHRCPGLPLVGINKVFLGAPKAFDF